MGGGQGKLGGGSSSLSANLQSLASSFGMYANGYFGTQGKSRYNQIRNIASANPEAAARSFFERAARGGEIEVASNGRATIAVFSSDARIVFRAESSSDGSAVVEITLPAGQGHFPSYQKIHFVKDSP